MDELWGVFWEYFAENWQCWNTEALHIDGLVQDCGICSALALQIAQPCAKLLIWTTLFNEWGVID